MKAELIATVRNGRLVLDVPIELPEGTELELEVADPDALEDAIDRAKLQAALRASDEDIAAGRMVDGRAVIEEQRKKR